jgi:hypothetical protein
MKTSSRWNRKDRKGLAMDAQPQEVYKYIQYSLHEPGLDVPQSHTPQSNSRPGNKYHHQHAQLGNSGVYKPSLHEFFLY